MYPIVRLGSTRSAQSMKPVLWPLLRHSGHDSGTKWMALTCVTERVRKLRSIPFTMGAPESEITASG